MPLYPPVIGKLPLSNLGKRIRGVKVIELERGLSGQVIPEFTWDTNPNTGLWHYCGFEDISAHDETVFGRDWVYSGNVSYATAVSGKSGNAMRLNAIDEAGMEARFLQPYASTDWEFDGGDDTLTDFTIRFWFKIAAVPTGTIIVPFLNTRLTKGWGITLGVDNLTFIVYGEIGGAGTNQIDIASAGVNAGQWNYVLAAYSSANESIYLKLNNGATQAQAHDKGITADPTETISLGGEFGGTRSPTLEFSIDELAIWSRVLSNNDITHDYNAGNGKFWPNLA